MTPHDDAQERTTLCLHVLERMHRRVAIDEAIGILAAEDDGRGPDRIRAGLRADHGRHGEDAEAARVVARTEANARPRSDPDWD